MFDNNKYEGIYYARFIASWYNVGGNKITFRGEFRDWLQQLVINGKNIPEDVINDICNMATNGKLELETNAKIFMKNR